MEISKEQLAKMAQAYKKAETQHVAQRAVTKNGILASAESVEVLESMSPKNFAFSIDVDDQAVANQKMSGRCWMFAALNTFRFEIIKKLNLENFELSQSYLFFYDKLEKANFFLESILETLDEPTGGRLIAWLLSSPMNDGGQWDMLCGLVDKYGVVPKDAMPETACSSSTGAPFWVRETTRWPSGLAGSMTYSTPA